MVGSTLLAEPADMQAGRIAVGPEDITASLPYVKSVHLCFDHHVSELERVGKHENLVIRPHVRGLKARVGETNDRISRLETRLENM